MLQDLLDALAAIEEGSANGLLDMHRTVLVVRAWMDPALVLERLREWTMSEEPALRIEAFGLTASLRLADLSDAVGTALVYETDDAALVAAGQAARAIQLALPPAVEARILRAQRRLDAEREAPVEVEEPGPPPSPAPGGR
jgi:hypothetical protein